MKGRGRRDAEDGELQREEYQGTEGRNGRSRPGQIGGGRICKGGIGVPSDSVGNFTLRMDSNLPLPLAGSFKGHTVCPPADPGRRQREPFLSRGIGSGGCLLYG